MGLRSAMPRPRFVGMNNVRLVTIEYDGEYVDTVKERYYGVWLDLPCEREEAY